VLALTAPTGGVVAGLIYAYTDVYVVAKETAAAAATFQGQHFGGVIVTKNTGTGKSFAIGDKVYRDASTKKATPNATGNTLVGYAIKAAAIGDTEVEVFFIALPVTAT
jgi:hypothetical protein